MEFRGLKDENMRNLGPVYLGPDENKSGRFMTLSVLIHTAMIAGVTLLGIPQYAPPLHEVVEFEVTSDKVGTTALADGSEKIAPTQGPTAPAPAPAPAPVSAPAPAKAPGPTLPVQKLVQEAPASIDDIAAPDLDTADAGEVAITKIDDKDFDSDFEKVDQSNHEAVKKAHQDFEDDANKVATESEAALAAAKQQEQQEARLAKEAADARRTQEAKAIADAQAAEQASQAQGKGAGTRGSPTEETKEVAGIPGGVRSLQQLRQIPGNKFPEYSAQERLLRQEGDVMFYAYVNKDGTLSQFKMGHSTGYRNLDGKTLSALRKWKFYPGQEGWVEMPYKWVLKGDAIEAGGQLRK